MKNRPFNDNYEPKNEGIFNIPWGDYVKIKALNNSYLKPLWQSPAHYLEQVKNPFPATPAMQIGSAFHYAVLEPDRFLAEVLPAPDWNKNTKKYKAWAADKQGKIILKKKDIQGVMRMALAVKASKAAGQYLGKGWPEKTLLWKDPDLGFWCKSRLDWVTPDRCLVDLKKTMDASPHGVKKSMRNYDYQRQAWFYLRGFQAATGMAPKEFVFIFVEAAPPFGLGVYSMDLYEVEETGRRREPLLLKYAEALETDTWPVYEDLVHDNFSIWGGGPSMIFDGPAPF